MTAAGREAEETVRRLVGEIGRYLATLRFDEAASVMEAFERWRGSPVQAVVPCHLPTVDLLETAARELAVDGHPALAAAILAASPLLAWTTYDTYDRAAIGEAFADGHAFAPVIGDGGPIPASGFELGLFVMAPRLFYRDHNHAAPELYAPLTGPHGWRFAPGDGLTWKDAHDPVWNEPFRPHATKVGDVPFLSIYVWTADIEQPASVLPAADWPEMEQMSPPPRG